MAKHRKHISLCMIVRNEERMLPSCLQSVWGIVNEIIVVDTGSTDRTVEIAESFGAIVIHEQWDNDFAKARNAGLEIATGEWILFLDADERLGTGAGEELLKYMDEPRACGLFLQIWNKADRNGNENEDEMEGSAGGSVHPVLRMFKSDPDIRFEGRIHEQIAASILRRWPDSAFYMTEVKVYHYGYRQEVIAEKNKQHRNMRLLELAVAEEPDNYFHRYNIGVEYLRAGMPAKALESFRAARQQSDFEKLSYMHLAVKYEVRSLLALHQYAEAAEVAAQGSRLAEDYPDLYHYRAIALAGLGRLREAVQAAEQALRIGASPSRYHTEEGLGTYRTAYLLGRMKEEQLDRAGVLEAYVSALRFKPQLLSPLYRLCSYIRITGEEHRLSSLLASRVICSSAAAVIKLAEVMLESGCDQAAQEWVGWHIGRLDGAHRQLLERWLRELEDDWNNLESDANADKDGTEAEKPNESVSASAGLTREYMYEMCDRADAHLELLQQHGLDGRRGGDNIAEASSYSYSKAIRLARLSIPIYEGWN